MKKNTVKLTEKQLHSVIKESVKNILKNKKQLKESNEAFDFEKTVMNALYDMRNDLDIFLENYGNTYPGEYGQNIINNSQEYQQALNNLLDAFNRFKDLCIDDWQKY